MALLSFTDYHNEQDAFTITQKLSELRIPKKQFVLTALEIAKSVQHLVPEAHKDSANLCIETVEKFLRGEATEVECGKAAASAYAAYYAYYAAAAASAATAATAAYYAASAAADIFRKYLPWELVCGYQVAGVLNRAEDEEFVLQVSKNQKLVSYATMILSEPSMHQNFEFFMKEFLKNYT